MTFRPRLLTVFGLVPTLLVAAVCLLRPTSLTRLELTTFDTVLRSGQMLILAPPAVRDSGEPEDKIQIYCFRSTVMRPTGEPVEAQPKLQATHGDGTAAP